MAFSIVDRIINIKVWKKYFNWKPWLHRFCIKWNIIKDYYVIGIDSGLYEDDYFYDCPKPNVQIKKDIRDLTESDLDEINYVVHLASLSNDPLGEFDKNLTEEINFKVKNLIDLSSKRKLRDLFMFPQSMYGISDETTELERMKVKKTSYSIC